MKKLLHLLTQMCVCASLCLCVCLSVHPCEKVPWFFTLQTDLYKIFKAHLTPRKVIFGAGDLDPLSPQGQVQPTKRGFLPNQSPPRLCGQGGGVIPFSETGQPGKQTIGSRFWFLAHSPKNPGWKAGLVGGEQNPGISVFFKQGPP